MPLDDFLFLPHPQASLLGRGARGVLGLLQRALFLALRRRNATAPGDESVLLGCLLLQRIFFIVFLTFLTTQAGFVCCCLTFTLVKTVLVKCLSIGHVRYINILTWLRGFRVKILYLVLFSLYSSLFWELRDKRSLKNLQF